MAVVFNVKKAIIDKNGELQRVKYKGAPPISLSYGLYLGDTFDEKSLIYKAYFLMSSFVPGTGEIVNPSEIRLNPRMKSLSLEEFPFSKKFTASEELITTSLQAGSEYWFAYTSDATSSLIDGRQITYESLDLICVADSPGLDGIKSLLLAFKLYNKVNQSS
jgi:hypothetical protein